jgi:hypothetical protein
MASAELQFCSLMMRRLSSKFVPACFSYSLSAVSKSNRRLELEEGEDIVLRCKCRTSFRDTASLLGCVMDLDRAWAAIKTQAL